MTVIDIAIQECIIWFHTLDILLMLAIFYLSWVELVKIFTFFYIIDPIQELISWRGNHSSENINMVGKWMVIETKYICIVIVKSRAYFFGGGMILMFWFDGGGGGDGSFWKETKKAVDWSKRNEQERHNDQCNFGDIKNSFLSLFSNVF